jgi:cellulose synthase operon protein C
VTRCTVGLLSLLLTATAAAAQPSARALYLRGEYDATITALAQPVNADDMALLARVLTDVGRANDALVRSASREREPVVASARARAHEALGQLAGADSAWSVAARGADSVFAQGERARLLGVRGDHARAETVAQVLIAGVLRRGGPRTSSESHALARAHRLLAADDAQQSREALRWFDRALQQDSLALDAMAELASLFVERFNFSDARQSIDRVLSINPRHPGALIEKARLFALDGGDPARDPLIVLHAVNPTHPDGRALSARRLLDAERYTDAVAEARRGLAVDSTAAAPWVVIAAARWLAHDTTEHRAALATAHARLPGSAQAEVELAELCARNRLYRDAVSFARAGVARDPRDARAHALLGINLMRIGQVTEARAALDTAFARDPFNVWVKNTLDLLDSYANAQTIATPHFDLVLEPRDATLMGLYAAPLAEEAWKALTTRYGFEPTERVRVEFFRSHADFSVRAVGLAGLGALGVAFGNVLAIDAPPARGRGEFNWGAVLWHEFAHTITLGMTENRVPRWVSEGLSVHEERRARPEWGGGATPSLIAAYGAGVLQPVSRLNDGFVRPRFPQEVVLSYALSAFVFELLESRKGIDGLRALLRGYRNGKETASLMREVYGLEPAALDSVFDGWFRTRFAREFTAVRGERRSEAGQESFSVNGPYPEALRAADRALKSKQWAEAAAAATRAIALFPSHTEPGSGYHLLATAQLAQRDSLSARRALQAIVATNGEAIDENITLAGLFEAAGDTTGAIASLRRAALIDPFDARVQVRLASLAVANRDWPVAILARRAILALGPADRADALYRLAMALSASGDQASARREVLRALDLAPEFEAAQELLLTIRASGKEP